jgi:predicted deacylase
VQASVDGFWYRRQNVGAWLEAGDTVGEMKDVDGDILAELSSPASGKLLFVATSLAVNAHDPLFAVGVP